MEPARGKTRPTQGTPTRRRKTKVLKNGSNYYYPVRPELLDRKVLVTDLRRLERKMFDSTIEHASMEHEQERVAEMEAKLRHDRRLMMQLESSVVASYEVLFTVIDKYEEDKQQAAEEVAKRTRLRELLRHSRCSEDHDWISEDMVRSYAEIGNLLTGQVESALYTEASSKKKKHFRKDEVVEKEVDEALEREVFRLTQREATYETQVAYQKDEIALLRSKLAECSLVESRERQMLLRERVDRRDFRDAVLELLSELSSGIHKRLGFLPSSSRHELNAFISAIAELDANDASLPIPSRDEVMALKFADSANLPPPPPT